MRQVFISYSSKDYSQALSVRNVLEQNGITCWMAPESIPGGSNYTKEIPIAIRECQAFVLMLSANAQNSHWVLKELDRAVNEGKIILPFQLEDIPLSDEFNFLLTGAQRYDAYQRKAEAMQNLVQRVKAIIQADQKTNPQTKQPAAAPQNAQPPVEDPLKGKSMNDLFGQFFSNSAAPASQTKAAPKTAPKTGTQSSSQCPACGSLDVTEFPDRVKPREFVEHLVSIVGNVVMGFVGLLFSAMIWMMLTDFLYYDMDLDGDLADLLYNMTPLVVIIAVVGCVILSGRLVSDWIKRQRIRKHIKVTECRCNTCQKKFQAVENQ